METPEHIRKQRIVGGNLALDLLNTQNGPAGEPPEDDVIRDYGDLVAWSQATGMLSDADSDELVREAGHHPVSSRAAFQRALATRDYLYELFSAIARGEAPPNGAIARLERDEAEALGHGKLVAVDGGYGWSWGSEGQLDLAQPVWTVIHAASTLLTSGPLDRVKGCGSCRFHFVDESKNRSRRWCSMEDCGTRVKMRRYVARRASTRSAALPARND